MAKAKAPEKRVRILDAALKVFAEQGFYNARVADVARAAGVADGTIYLYFQNKDDLLISLFEERMEEIIAALRADLEATGGDALVRLRRMIERHLSMAVESPLLAEFITVELRQSAKFVREYENPRFQEYLTVLRDLVEEGQREGLIRSGMDSRLIVRAIFGALDEVLLTLTLASTTRSIDFREVAETLCDLFFHGMASGPRPGTMPRGPVVAP